MYEVNPICKDGKPLSLKTDGHLRLVFIGVGSAFAKRRRQSNMLLIQGDHHVLIDCGTQGPLALNDLGLSVRDVDCYLPTHSHADHIGGFEEKPVRPAPAPAEIDRSARLSGPFVEQKPVGWRRIL